MHEPTMVDVAARAGVSRQLVSIVMRGAPGASTETRQRVLWVAEELGYRPHLGARTLRQSRQRHIGVTFAPAHAAEQEMVEAMYVAAGEEGHTVVLSAQTRSRSTGQAVEELLGYRAAALVAIGPELSHEELAALAARAGVPLVVVGAGDRNASYDVVRSAGDHGIAAVVRHLVELGHRRLTFVHAPAMPVGALRLAGYLAAMAEAGLAPDVLEAAAGGYTEEYGAQAARELLRRPALPTAVVAGNDQQAAGVLHVLTRAGLSVPRDVSVTGFDDSSAARLSYVDLTTARQDPEQMGRAAITLAVRRAGRPTVEPDLVEVEPTLALRSSSGPPSN